ncbi:hypothetical protein VQ056_05815 [Paenibacillus sp. JTLBN-2024]
MNWLRGKEGKQSLGAGVWFELTAGALALVLAAALTNMPTAASSPGRSTCSRRWKTKRSSR